MEGGRAEVQDGSRRRTEDTEDGARAKNQGTFACAGRPFGLRPLRITLTLGLTVPLERNREGYLA